MYLFLEVCGNDICYLESGIEVSDVDSVLFLDTGHNFILILSFLYPKSMSYVVSHSVKGFDT